MSGQFDSTNPYLVLIGAPGAGKSTFARTYFRRNEVVSSDRIRGMIGDHEHDQRANPFAFPALYSIIEGRTQLGKTVVVDATNRTEEERAKATDSAIRWCRPAIAVVFLTPLEVCLERNARRPKKLRVDEGWVRETHDMIAADLNPATTWTPPRFTGVLFVAHEGHGYTGGMLSPSGWRFAQADWMDNARDTWPDWRGPEKCPSFHGSDWDRRSQLRWS